MHCENKNSYLQLVCAVNPRIINKAVAAAMQKKYLKDVHDEFPPMQRLESQEPSLYAPNVDITRAKLGFGRIGLRILNRQLNDPDSLKRLQAIHTVMDRLKISEDAMFLINLNVVYRLINMMMDKNPVVREKICMCITELAKYHQGRIRIATRPALVNNLMYIIMNDRKEIRYQAALTLSTIAKDRCSCEFITKVPDIVENLLKVIKKEHSGIVLLHLRTLEVLFEYNPEPALRANAFQIMLQLFKDKDTKIGSQAMENMAQLCKHEVGQALADEHDINHQLVLHVLKSSHINLVTSATGVLCYTTLSTRSKWRIKEYCSKLTRTLVRLVQTFNKPMLQLRCLQILINVCDCPDIRYRVKAYWEEKIKNTAIRTHEEWHGGTTITSFGYETGHYYRTMSIEGVESIKNAEGDNTYVVNVHSYVRTINDKKQQLIDYLNFKPWK